MAEYEISHLLIISAHPQPQQQLQFSHCDKCIAKTRRLCLGRGRCEGDNSRLLAAKETNEKKRARAFAPITQFQFLVCTYTHTHTHSPYKKLSTSMCVCVCVNMCKKWTRSTRSKANCNTARKKKRQHCFVVVNNKFSSCAKWWHTFTHIHTDTSRLLCAHQHRHVHTADHHTPSLFMSLSHSFSLQ